MRPAPGRTGRLRRSRDRRVVRPRRRTANAARRLPQATAARTTTARSACCRVTSLDFVLATQPKEWEKLAQHHGAAVKEQFLKRLASRDRAARHARRPAQRHQGLRLQVPARVLPAGERPQRGDAPAPRGEPLLRRSAGPLQREQRELPRPGALPERHSDLHGGAQEPAQRRRTSRTRSGSTRPTAIRASRCSRTAAAWRTSPSTRTSSSSPRSFAGAKTLFLPFNQGKFGGAGNPPVPPTQKGYATAYLWEDTWARDSVLDLVRQFIHEVEEEDDKGRKTGKRFLIFPRYQQLDAVRRLVAHARMLGHRTALPDPALRRQRQELHHRLAGSPAFDLARRNRPAGLRLDHRRHRPAGPRPPASDDDAAVRADAWRRGEHRHHIAPAQGGARVGQDDHRHHAAEVPGDREADR